jgi:hypothetical protein
MKILKFEEYRLVLEAEIDATPEPVEPLPQTSPTQPSQPSPSPLPDFGEPSTLPPDPNAPVVNNAPVNIKLVMLDPDRKWHTSYTDGGGVKRYPEYEIVPADLEKWITDSNLTAQRDAIMQAIQGKKSMDKEIFTKFKSALATSKLGKNRGDLDIQYDPNKEPSTTNLDIIFVKPV